MIPDAAPQQSLVVVHFSYSPEHAGACIVHTSAAAVARLAVPPAALVARHAACPFAAARLDRPVAARVAGVELLRGEVERGVARVASPASRSRSTAATQSFLSVICVVPR